MRIVKASHWSALLMTVFLFVLPESSFPQEPISPFGQSNAFAFNTNKIGFGDSAIMMISSTTDDGGIPAATSLGIPMPNPFNPRITILFNVGHQGPVELNIYDLAGRHIKNLISQDFEEGQYSEQWDGRDNIGSLMPAGVYLVRIKDESTTDSKKITLVK